MLEDFTITDWYDPDWLIASVTLILVNDFRSTSNLEVDEVSSLVWSPAGGKVEVVYPEY